MKQVSYEEYMKAKMDILKGAKEVKEISRFENNLIHRVFLTEWHNFWEIQEGPKVEFWSTKYPESRVYMDWDISDLKRKEELEHKLAELELEIASVKAKLKEFEV